MKKYITIAIFMTILASINMGCHEDNNGSSTTMRTTAFDGAQGNCTNGGVKLEIVVDGVTDNAQTQYICNGTQGQAGQGGQSSTNTTMRTTRFDGSQGNCTNGGVKIEFLVDGIVDDTQTQYLCNGAQGQAGQGQSGTNTTMRTTAFDGAQGSCTNGGVKIEVLVDGVVDSSQTQYICNGAKGEQGDAGCSNGEKSCDGACVDVSTSITNCGACGHDCNTSKPLHAKTMACAESQCTIVDCDDGYLANADRCVSCHEIDGWAMCNSKCIQIDSDNNNCGDCGKKCDEGLSCVNSQCIGNTTCSGVATNTDSSLDHCGKCDNRCPNGKTCIDGQCVTGYGKAYCGTDILQIGDIDQCSGCGDKCSDGKICKNNACVDGAGPSYCNGRATNTLNDVSNCGSCGHRCENSNCVNGECVDGQGEYATDEMYCNGVIIHALSDSANCNGCGNHCAKGLQCVSGTCQPYQLNSDSTLTCNGNNNVKPYSDGRNCGKCGNVCISGICEAAYCKSYCNGISVNTAVDFYNCGQCGKKCVDGEICNNGVCTTGIGITSCNGIPANTASDKYNCGQCDYNCAPNQTCLNGTCVTFSVGDIIIFGHYEQDNNTTNGKEPIEWRILDINDAGEFLVISDKVLDVQRYNQTRTSITWAESTIRSWLNGYAAYYNRSRTDFRSDNFIDAAFTAEEKAKIVASNVPAHANPSYSTSIASPGNATTDKVFLLSIVEANTYFTSDSDRLADATRYAVKKGARVSGSESRKTSSDGTCSDVHCYAYWWLRSPGCGGELGTSVETDGSVNYLGSGVSYDNNGVRPALWVK